MAEGFVGLSVLATLRNPPNAKVRGLVTNVVAGELTLSKVTWLADGLRTPILLVPGSNILEVEIEPDLIPPKPLIEAKPTKTFVDPAIVSYGKPEVFERPSFSHTQANGQQQPKETTKAAAFPTSATPQFPASPSIPRVNSSLGTNERALNPDSPKSVKDHSASATLTGPFNDISLTGPEHQSQGLIDHIANNQIDPKLQTPRVFAATQSPKTHSRRGKRPRKSTGPVSTQNTAEPDLSTSLSAQKRRNHNDKKGWRQTAFLEEPAMANSYSRRADLAFATPDPALTPGPAMQSRPSPDPMKTMRRKNREKEDQNGWATGEATDIQDMGDFDFEENHKKFDKRKIFDQIRRDDTTADEDRLVSFNRLPSTRLGTAGGKNLHYTENVLDSPIQKHVEHSSGDSEIEAPISSGRSLSRASTRRNVPSRKASALANSSFDRVASPKIKTDSSTSFRKTSVSQPKPSLIITPSRRPCPCVSPLQMLELEQLATAELGLTEDMMTENAARSIAQTAHGLTSGDDPTQNTSALIVVLAGNNKTGSRAIATARHLRNHGARVILCILGLEREDDLLDSVRRQLKIFCNCGGQAIKQDALMRTLRKLQSPADLIIDALLGIHISFDDLRSDDQAAYFQLVCWANGNDADTLALDIPSGIDASTGEATSHDSTPLVITAQHVFSLGAPKTGLLTFLAKLDDTMMPNLAVADIGISPVAWKKFGTRRRHGVEFAVSWVAGLEFQPAL